MKQSLQQKIIVALDVATVKDALRLVDELRPYVQFFKIGLELVSSAGIGAVREVIGHGGQVFLDCKYHDIPNTVAGASRAVAGLGVQMFNVHALGGLDMMAAAVRASAAEAGRLGIRRPLVLAVTVLTSISETVMNNELRIPGDVESQVVRLSKLAAKAGADGVVASPHEIRAIREHVPADLVIVTPGVRPVWAGRQDQERVMTPAEAVRLGASHLVIGRPITSPPPGIGGPAEAVRHILDEIEEALG